MPLFAQNIRCAGEMPGRNSINKADQKGVKVAIFLIVAIFILGLLLDFLIITSRLNGFHIFNNSFFVLFARNETTVIPFLLMFLLLFGLFLFSDRTISTWPHNSGDIFPKNPIRVWGIALSVVLIAWLGDNLILHRFPLSNDEYLPRFQAQIFAAGKIVSFIDPAYKEFGKALTPIFVVYDPLHGSWTSSYLPVYAALRTGFLTIGIESLTNPFLAGLSLVFLAALAKRVWPREASAPLLAVILLASSTQFLINSMTSYAMPAHLCLNLAWLYFYTRRDKWGNLMMPWIGFFALGLHNPFVHALFVAPFLISLLWEKRFKLICYFGAVYAGAILVWFLWWTQVSHLPSDFMKALEFPGSYQLLIQPMNLTLLFSWQSMVASVLAIMTIGCWRDLTPFFRTLAWGCLVTFGFYFFYPVDQVLGWGYRFFYGVLGNFVLLATAGWYRLKELLGLKKAWGFLLLGTGLALLVQFPIRCLQVESFIRPFSRSSQYIQSLPQSFVIINPKEVWYAQLLVRNDPFLLNHPKLLFAQSLAKEQKAKLETMGDVYEIKPEELARYGMHPVSPSLRKQY